MKRHLLIVDDQNDLLVVMKRELGRRMHLEVLTTYSVEKALRIVEENTVCMVISDVNLGQDSGCALAEILHSDRPEIPVLLMSAYHSTANRERAQAVGAVAFLEKPFTAQQLVDEVANFLPPLKTKLPLSKPALGLSATSHFEAEDLVQVFCLNGRSVVITLNDPKGLFGKIYLQRGTVQHAEFGELSGDDAFHALLSLNSPELTVGEWDRPILQTIKTSWEKLLLVSAVNKDRGEQDNLSALG